MLYQEAYDAYYQEDYKRAVECFSKLVVLEPFFARSWRGFAASLQQEKRYEEALKGWAMLTLIDSSAESHLYAAECLIALGQKQEALKALTVAEKETLMPEWEKKICYLRKICDSTH